MTASDVDKIIPFPRARSRAGDRKGPARPTEATGRWQVITPLLGWGGTVLALAAPDGDGGAVFYAGSTAGCFRSVDRGTTWEPVNDGLTSPYIQALVASPRFARDRTLFAGTLGSGVMRTTNGGETWGPVDFWQGAQAVTALALSPDFPEEGTILAGTQSEGVYRSTNGGRTWSPANFGINDLSVMALALSPGFAEDETAFCLAGDGLYRSTNGARAWRPVTRGLDTDAVQAVAVSPSFVEDGTVFVGTEDLGVFRSTDRGLSWQPANDGLTNLSVNAVWLSPGYDSDRAVFAGTAGSGVFRSTDGGRSWSPVVADELGELAVMALASDSSGQSLVAGLHQSGLFRSVDAGASWEPANTGLAARSMSSLAVSPAFHEDRTLFAAGIEDGILRSRDAGETWEHVNQGLPGPQILSLAVSPKYGTDKSLLVALAEGLFRSMDGGATWAPAGPEGLSDPRMVAYSGDTSAGQVYVGLASGQRAYLRENGAICVSSAAHSPRRRSSAPPCLPTLAPITPSCWPRSRPPGPCVAVESAPPGRVSRSARTPRRASLPSGEAWTPGGAGPPSWSRSPAPAGLPSLSPPITGATRRPAVTAFSWALALLSSDRCGAASSCGWRSASAGPIPPFCRSPCRRGPSGVVRSSPGRLMACSALTTRASPGMPCAKGYTAARWSPSPCRRHTRREGKPLP